MKIRVLIVDDELLARMKIRQLLEREPDVEVIGECNDATQAIGFIQQQHPDLVFMDVQMGEETGLDVLRALPLEKRPTTIFVTAHRRHALEAFDLRALDFLLKPVSRSRFQEAMARAREKLVANPGTEQAGLSLETEAALSPGRLAIKTGGQTVFVPVERLDYVESAANYAILHVGSETHVLRETLTNPETKLPEPRFLRVSRSVIVNLAFIDRTQQSSRRQRVLRLRNGKEIPVTCSLRDIRRRLESLL